MQRKERKLLRKSAAVAHRQGVPQPFSCDFLLAPAYKKENPIAMRYFDTPMILMLSEENFAKAREFAAAVVPTVNYRDSLQFNTEKIRDDHFVSKLGEEAVRQAFEFLVLQVQGPDYTIYNGKQKSWESDLYVNGVALAVKTQRKSAAQRYGLSWTFQKSRFRTDPILQKPEAWVCFVEFDDVAATPYFTIFPPFQIKNLPFKAPRLAKLLDKKIAVYAEDFLENYCNIKS